MSDPSAIPVLEEEREPASPLAAERVFMSYRRGDAGDVTGRIFDRLTAHFGGDSVFMDTAGIPPGVDFLEYIRGVIADCRVLLVVIGSDWIDYADGEGRPRLWNPDDLVRIEIESAFQCNVPVVPILVRQGQMPKPEQLPKSLRRLTQLNALAVRSGADFDPHMHRLLQRLEKSFELTPLDKAATLEPEPPTVQAGGCQECGTPNEEGRRFCSSCGNPLYAPCFRCGNSNGTWIEFCGQCGANLFSDRKAQQETVQQQRREIESLRAELRLEETLDLLAEMARLDHPCLLPSAKWAEETLEQTQKQLYDITVERATLASEARRLLARSEYEQAVGLLEQLPAPWRTRDYEELRRKAEAARDESEALLQHVASAIDAREFEQLGQEVARLLELLGETRVRALVQPWLTHVGRLAEHALRAEQYVATEQFLRQVPEALRSEEMNGWLREAVTALETVALVADEIQRAAQQRYRRLDYPATIGLIDELPEAFRTREIQELRKRAVDRQREVEHLCHEADHARQSLDADKLMAALDRLVQLAPAELSRHTIARAVFEEEDCSPSHFSQFCFFLEQIRCGNEEQARSALRGVHIESPMMQRLHRRLKHALVGAVWQTKVGSFGRVDCLKSAASGKSLFVAATGKIVSLAAADGCESFSSAEAGIQRFSYLRVSRDGRLGLLGGDVAEMRLVEWRGDHFRQRPVPGGPHESIIVSAFSLGSRYLITYHADVSAVRLWDLENGREIRRGFWGKPCIERVGLVIDMAAAAGSPRIVTTGSEGLVLWNLENGERIASLGPPHEAPQRLVVSGDGCYIASVLPGADRVQIFHSEEARQVRTVDVVDARISTAALSHAGDQLLCGCSDGSVRLFDLEESCEACRFQFISKCDQTPRQASTRAERAACPIGVHEAAADLEPKFLDFLGEEPRAACVVGQTVVMLGTPEPA